MARRRKGVMSEELKYTLAKELGFYDTVQSEGWGGIRAKDAGNMVKRALQIAEKALAEQERRQGPAPPAARVQAAPPAYSAAAARPAESARAGAYGAWAPAGAGAAGSPLAGGPLSGRPRR